VVLVTTPSSTLTKGCSLKPSQVLSGGFDFSPNSSQLSKLSQDLTLVRSSLKLPEGVPLPIGVGFLTFESANFIPAITPILTEHKPVAIWLFAPASREDHAAIIPRLKGLGESWKLKVWVQIGSVQAAQEAVEDGADVIVAQGIDAGGHQ
jgi:nitronate monooxygenase